MRSIRANNKVHVALIAASLSAILFNLWFFRDRSGMGMPARQLPTRQEINNAPSVMRDDKIPGNPDAAEAQMKRLFSVLQASLKRHGHYPDETAGEALDLDLFAHEIDPEVLKTNNIQQIMKPYRAVMLNPDMKYADRTALSKEPETYCPWAMPATRHDGTRVGSPKSGAGRDVLAWTDMYFHRNIQIGANETTKMRPRGFYLVLWEDGTTERISWNKVRWVPRGKPFPEYFPGQAGPPPTGSLSFGEYQKMSREQYENWGKHP